MPFPYPVVVHRRQRSGTDRYGGAVYSAVDEPVTALAFDPGLLTQADQGWAATASQPTVYLPPYIDVSMIDAVTADGVRYEVDDAPPSAPQNPFTGWRPGKVVRLKLPTG